MLINYAHIKKYDDFQEIFDANILITGNPARQKEEICENMWKVGFDKKLIKKLTMQDLQQFIEKLVQVRIEQLKRQMNYTPVTFYVWIDEMSQHLCFDFLSGKDIVLPPEGRFNILSSVDQILASFLAEVQRVATHGNLQDFRVINPGDPGWDDDDFWGEKIQQQYIQDIYITTLEPQ
ncbi:MAG TPA: hypothetical protein VGT41_06570 [Candidatus Babeliales bacterium]|nr:hypothetical protein [Candidatus Babeliales bacterium]